MGHMLTRRDLDLLKRQFRIWNPEAFPGLTERLEKGAVPVDILHGYDETPAGGMAAGHKPHVMCAFGHLHWHGYIIRLEDGRVALIGKDCARGHFGHDLIETLETRFNDDKDRQFQIRRLLAIQKALPAALLELKTLAGSTAVVGFDALFRSLAHKFGLASRKLVESVRNTEGRLIAYKKERDRDAEEKAAKRSRPDLFGDVDFALSPGARRVAVANLRKHLDSQPLLYKDVPVDIGPCHGWRVLIASERSTPARLVAEATQAAQRANDPKPIDLWTKADFGHMRRAIDDTFDSLGKAKSLVNDVIALTHAPNRERIAQWAKEANLQIEFDMPDSFSWPAMPFLDALRAARDMVDEN